MDPEPTRRRIGFGTALYGVVGHPLRHSLSPLMHNRAFEALGIDAVYLPFETADIQGAIGGARALGIQGLSITLPHKQAVMACLDRLDPLAEKIGAVNTVVKRGKKLVGFNTDASGALEALESRLGERSLSGMSCLLVGAGGAARAVGFALQERGARLALWNRSRQRGEQAAAALGGRFLSAAEVPDFRADLLVNATPVGMFPGVDACPVPDRMLKKGMVVMDLVYNPVQTLLLSKAKARGCIPISGLDMFLFQGAAQLRLWTGRKAPMETLRAALSKALVP